MSADLPDTGSGLNQGPGPVVGTEMGSTEPEEPKVPDQQPLGGGEEEDDLLPQVERPTVGPDNWTGG